MSVNLENFRLWDKNCPKNKNDKNFEKLNIEIEISIKKSTTVPNFGQFEALQILGPSLPKNMNEKN